MTGDTLFALADQWGREQPDRAALIDGGTRKVVRYGDLASVITVTASAFAELGIGPGARCIVIMQRSVALIETVLALSRLGAECLPLDCSSPRLRSLDEARTALSPEFVIHDRARRDCATWRREGETWIDITKVPRAAEPPRRLIEPSGGTPLYLNATSGSTGVSKMVIATHGETIANAYACEHALGIEPGGVHLSTFRVHVHDLFVRALVTGGTAILLPGAEDPVSLATALARFRVNYLMINPLMLAALMAVLKRGDLRPHLRLVECGGGPLSGVVRRVVGSATGARVVGVWGSTETAGVALAPPPGRTSRGHALGMPLPGYDVTIVDTSGMPVPTGVEGEMVVRGDAVALGYIGAEAGNPRLRARSFRTGDLVRRHDDGWIEFRGRASNAFKVAGSWINAERIEAAIREDPAVRDVVVVPQPHRTFGCVPVALVVMNPGAPPEPDVECLRDRLEDPNLEMPERFVAMTGLPRTAAGKIDRAASSVLVTGRDRKRRRGFHPSKTWVSVWRAIGHLRLKARFFAHPFISLRLLRLLARERRI